MKLTYSISGKDGPIVRITETPERKLPNGLSGFYGLLVNDIPAGSVLNIVISGDKSEIAEDMAELLQEIYDEGQGGEYRPQIQSTLVKFKRAQKES